MVSVFNNFKFDLGKLNLLFLLLLILSIPTQESPKLIFWGLYVISSVFLISRISPKNKWDALDTMVTIWMFSGLVVAFFSGINHKEWSGSTDLIIFTSVLLILKRINHPFNDTKTVFNTILLSTLLASFLAIWKLFFLGSGSELELHSIGHVNHTAIYLSLSLSVVIAMLYSRWNVSSTTHRLFLLSVYVSLALALVLTDSRAAILASVLLLFLFLVIYRKHLALSFLLISLLLFFIGGNYIISGGGVIEKQVDQLDRGIFFKARVKIWRSAMLAWKQYPAFGVGIKNYDQISLEELLTWCRAEKTECSPDDYLPYAHGHSLYINTLTERGLFGFFVVFINISMLIYFIYKYRPKVADETEYIMLWTAAFGVLFLNLSIGLLNTTLHHENALLSMIVIGLWLGKMNKKIE